MTIKLIVAVDQGNAIGWSDGRLPWKLPVDMKRFKELTSGQTVVMGRSTYLSLGRPDGLPNRHNVVLTRRPYSEVRSQFGNVDIISSFDWIHKDAQRGKVIWICGGAQVYTEALESQIVDELFVTLVHENSGADVTLPYDFYSWKLFLLRQRKLGVNWHLDSVEEPTCDTSSPRISFLHFTKLHNV